MQEFKHPSYPGKTFYHCPVCREYVDKKKAIGAVVRVANETAFMVCAVKCTPKVVELLKHAYPPPFPSDFTPV